MTRHHDGWYQSLSPTAHVGTRYQFRINEDLVVPDPASFFQPDDVWAPSEVIDTAAFRDSVLYPGRPWAEAVIYELHVGTFSEEGTYAGVEKKLPYLRDLGITAIELMPLNDVPGRHNWGYDGVLLNAPNARYGRPEDLKRLVRAAHALDIMVYLDVVYNHFGPQLNYLHLYAESFFTTQPHQRVLDQELAHERAVVSLEVDGRAPAGAVARGEEAFRVEVQVIQLRPEMVIDDVEIDHDVEGVRRA